MWILPKQLLTSASAPDTEELTLDCEEFCQAAEQSLMWRSKPSPSRTWLQRWKRESWMRRLYGQTLKPVSGRSFVTAWILSVAAIRANPSQRRGTARVAMTPDTSGLSYKGQLGLFDQDTASLRMSKDILPSALRTSAMTWESWVMSLRQEYSVRLKSAHLTREKECSSWPTATARDWKGCGNAVQRKDGKHRMDTLEAVALFGPPAPENPSTSGKSQELWPTPDTQNHRDGTVRRKDSYGSHGVSLHHKIAETENWPTPRNMTGGTCKNGAKHCDLKSKAGGKLNPNWVEQLMGLQVGWTQLPTEWIG